MIDISVLKSKRKSSSKFEVMINARRLRVELSKNIMSDIKFENLNNENDIYQMKYMRNIINDLLRRMTDNISMANSIYVSNMTEYEERRKFQDYAIGNCYQIADELYYLILFFRNRGIEVNVNKYSRSIKLINNERQLLSAWRKSENSFKKKYVKSDCNNEQHNNV